MFDEPHESPYSEERYRALHDELEKKLEKIGCYVRNTGFQQPVDNDGNFVGDPFLILECQVGGVAWLPRVQDPEQDKFNDEFRGIEGDESKEEFEEIRRKAAERRARGESLLEDDPEADEAPDEG